MKSSNGFASVAYDSGRKQLVPQFTNRKDVGCATKTVRRMLGSIRKMHLSIMRKINRCLFGGRS